MFIVFIDEKLLVESKSEGNIAETDRTDNERFFKIGKTLFFIGKVSEELKQGL